MDDTRETLPPPQVTESAIITDSTQVVEPAHKVLPAAEPQPLRKPVGEWADELRIPDGKFNGANLVERWLATPRTVLTRRRGQLEPGREVTREQFDAALARVDQVVCR